MIHSHLADADIPLTLRLRISDAALLLANYYFELAYLEEQILLFPEDEGLKRQRTRAASSILRLTADMQKQATIIAAQIK